MTKRHDIIPLGYGAGRLKIKNDEILIKHPQTPTDNNKIKNEGIVLVGHTHTPQNKIKGNLINIYLASLSDIKMNNYSLPGFIKATISFNNGFFAHSNFEQYVFFDKMYKINEISYEIQSKKKSNTIKYEEERVPYKKKLI